MTLTEARNTLQKKLEAVYEKNEAANVAELVLEFLTELPRTERIKQKDRVLAAGEESRLLSIGSRLLQNEPVQYVLGEAWFAGMKLQVNKHVLIPRPETEELAGWIRNDLKNLAATPGHTYTIIDIGTGSGCLAVYLSKKISGAEITAIDVCSEALGVAMENAMRHDAEVNFVRMDFLDPSQWEKLGQYDVIVSNPPYIRQSEAAAMHTRVKDFEPHLALFVPDQDALLFYTALADFGRVHLKPSGSAYMELNETMGESVAELFYDAGYRTVELKKDMQGKERMLKAALLNNPPLT